MCEMSIIAGSLRCARPILWEWPDEEYSYYSGTGGTGFFVRYCTNVYFVMARHCLPSDGKPDNLRITITVPGKSDEFMPFEAQFDHKCESDAEADLCDLSLFRVALTRLNESQKCGIFPLELGSDRFIRPTDVCVQHLFVRGYPGELRSTEYGVKKIKVRAFLAEVSAPKEDARIKHIYSVNCSFPGELGPGGLSGAPVVATVKDSGGRESIFLAGMVITAGDGTLRLIGGRVLEWALKLAHSGDRPPQ